MSINQKAIEHEITGGLAKLYWDAVEIVKTYKISESHHFALREATASYHNALLRGYHAKPAHNV